MLSQRLVFGAVLIAALLGLLYLDHRFAAGALSAEWAGALGIGLARLDGLIVAVVLCVLVAVGARELHGLLFAAGHASPLVWPMVACVALVLVPFVGANQRAGAGGAGGQPIDRYCLVVLVLAFFGTALVVAARRRPQGGLGAITAAMLIVVYLGLLPQFVMRIRLANPTHGVWLLLYYIGAVKVCDIGAYFSGRYLGRHKLIEWLSPKKTVEGLVGGVAASVLFAVVVAVWVRHSADAGSGLAELLPAPGAAAAFGLVMGLVGQAGDLLESLFKRDAQAKDSAAAIPAFGGVLDILDSLLPAAPLAYWILVK